MKLLRQRFLGTLHLAFGPLLIQAIRGFFQHRAHKMAAILAFYSILSAAPLFVVLLALADWIWGERLFTPQSLQALDGYLGTESIELLQDAVISSQTPNRAGVAASASTIVLFFSSTLLFSQLRESLATIWNLDQRAGAIRSFLRKRFLALATILLIQPLILVSTAAKSMLAVFRGWIAAALPTPALLWAIVDWLVFWSWFGLLVAMVFRLLSRPRTIAWRDIFPGAAVASFLFLVGNELLALYLSRAAVASIYGAAGALVTMSLWVYYSSMTLLFGAEYTEACTNWKSAARDDATPLPRREIPSPSQGSAVTSDTSP